MLARGNFIGTHVEDAGVAELACFCSPLARWSLRRPLPRSSSSSPAAYNHPAQPPSGGIRSWSVRPQHVGPHGQHGPRLFLAQQPRHLPQTILS